ncbi:BamA/TamA family outer membrane protein [Spirosoma sp. KCTC 42546]|uniref:BamA/TamA family outer membrane protein n=1 Tax=Spirosoma sp. KCTC 42546 TaxID=2520506 RepID=UPI001156F88E|nr:BamA/TamA family outer membrane protein [Spirosoma sp. KCTC 42546]QDK79489.1 BamA/TamA family outer membrane protein [Spirosoma sp. KCTC 42546]
MIPKTWPTLILALTVFLLSSQVVFATVSTDSTQKIVVRSITFKGNYRTRDRIILREMTLHVGDSVRLADLPGRVAWDQRNISNTTLFVTVDMGTQLIPSADSTQLAQLDLTVTMKERWYFVAYPVFDLADRNFNEWWYDRGHDFSRVIYGGHLSYRNVTGNNDKLQVIFERGFLQRTILSYSKPYIDRAQKIGLRMDVGYVTNKEIPYRTQFDKWVYVKSEEVLRERKYAALTLTHRRGLYHYHTLDTRYTQNTIADTIAKLNPDYLLDGSTNQHFLAMSYNYRYDRRDNVVYPLQGTLFSAGIGVSGILPTDNFHFLDLATSITRYWPLGGHFYAAGSLRARSTWPTRQPYISLRGLGSSTDMVRGYELFVVDGQRTFIWRNSLRYQLFNVRKQLNWLHVRQFNTVPIAAYLTVFGDTGYVSSTVAEQYQSRLANRLLAGTGLSLDVVSFYNLVMRFSGTINAQGNTGFFFNLAQEL